MNAFFAGFVIWAAPPCGCNRKSKGLLIASAIPRGGKARVIIECPRCEASWLVDGRYTRDGEPAK